MAEIYCGFLDKCGITDIVLLGEQRSYHKHAIEADQARNIRVTVTDFGYLRPDWIMLERDGMGGNSRFPRDPEAILKLAAEVPKADLERRYSDSFWTMAAGDMLYQLANFCFWWLFPTIAVLISGITRYGIIHRSADAFFLPRLAIDMLRKDCRR